MGGIFAVIGDWIIGFFGRLFLQKAEKKLVTVIDEEINHHVAINDMEALKRAQTDEAKNALLKKIASDSFPVKPG